MTDPTRRYLPDAADGTESRIASIREAGAPFPPSLAARMVELTEGVEVDLDDPLDPAIEM